MIAGMARQIRTIELIFGPVSRAPKLERRAVGLGAAPWKIMPRHPGNGERQKRTDSAVRKAQKQTHNKTDLVRLNVAKEPTVRPRGRA